MVDGGAAFAAAINVVSDATFASASFAQSLQSVLDKLGLGGSRRLPRARAGVLRGRP